jgi:trehalose-6-phosphate synthase
MLTALPHHERLIPSLCEYDVVGFQTGDDAFNFSRYLTRECSLHSRDFNFIVAETSSRLMKRFDFSTSWERGQVSIAFEGACCAGLTLQLPQKTVGPLSYVIT